MQSPSLVALLGLAAGLMVTACASAPAEPRESAPSASAPAHESAATASATPSPEPAQAVSAPPVEGTASTESVEDSEAEASSDPLASRPTAGKSAATGAIPKVRVQEPTVGPAYGPEIIQRVIRSSLKKANRCLERFADAPASKPAVLRFVILGDGSVKQVEYVQNGKAIKPDERQSCLLGVFKGMTFPAPPGGGSITVTYPLNVDPVD